MIKTLVLLFLSISFLNADVIHLSSPLDQLNTLDYETPQGRSLKIPKSTQLILFSFEKKTSAIVNAYIEDQEPFYMPKHHAIFIADISKMPVIITNLFALPKLKKFKHLIYLHYDDHLKENVPYQEEKITIARIKEGKVKSISYASSKEELEAALQQCYL